MEDYSKYQEINARPVGGFAFYQYNLYAIPGANVPLHWHEEVEIMFTKTDGALILDGKKIDFHENDILFVNPRQLHSTYHEKSGWSYHIVIHPDLFGSHDILDAKDMNIRFPEKIRPGDTTCINLLEDIIHIPSLTSPENKLYAMSRLYELLYHLIDSGYAVIESNPEITIQSEYVKSAIGYIHHNLRHRISVKSIADDVGISKEYLMRLFKSYTGETINSYIQSRKLEAAKRDLLSGYSLKDITYKYDYSDVSYFCKLFKKHYGISPGKLS